ncbi:MAG TPA: tRNA-dihydrouridine synthase family protein [Planctomycetota bacterium]|nr:tRNA-dihydrouridine synthase family protein [Planctomycetota bacterium]
MSASILPPPRIGSLQLASALALAPMSGYADAAFRVEIRRLGGLGLAWTELVSPRKLLEGSEETGIILKRLPGDRPLGFHLYGAEEEYLVEAARRALDQGFDLLDFNLGCPVRKVTRKGGGAALLERPEEAARLAGRLVAVAAGRAPVTAKIRLGPDRANLNAPELARMLSAAGVAALTVHGRTADEDYDRPADPAGIRAVVAAVPSIPVFANGDVDSPAAARRMLETTGAAGLAVGRAALADPWVLARIAADLAGEVFSEPSRAERAAFLVGHFLTLLEMRGEEMACRSFRKWGELCAPALGLSGEARERFAKLERAREIEALARELLAGG